MSDAPRYVACPKCHGLGYITLPTRSAPCYACGGATDDFTTRQPLTTFFLTRQGAQVPGRQGTGIVTDKKALRIIASEEGRRRISTQLQTLNNAELESLDQ